MMDLRSKLHAAISADNAPEGYMYADCSEAISTWELEGGHFLWIKEGEKELFFVALDDTPINTIVFTRIIEVIPSIEQYDTHPSVKSILDVETFLSLMDGTLSPPLLGLKEFSDALGWTKQKLNIYMNRHPNMFPMPFVRLASGPVWTKSQVDGCIHANKGEA